MSADGVEEREFDRDEAYERDIDNADINTMLADEARDDLEATVIAPIIPPIIVRTDDERITELKALLADIALGADMMLEPALGLRGAMLGYVREVRRVARAGRGI